ncbi:MAG: hypothetical protein PHH04_01685 [Thomasclavelia sp.]|nr:hypothetical protein [Thomasclavelia sp.]
MADETYITKKIKTNTKELVDKTKKHNEGKKEYDLGSTSIPSIEDINNIGTNFLSNTNNLNKRIKHVGDNLLTFIKEFEKQDQENANKMNKG